MKLPHAIEFKPDGTSDVCNNQQRSLWKSFAVYQYKLTTAWDTSTLEYENNIFSKYNWYHNERIK